MNTRPICLCLLLTYAANVWHFYIHYDILYTIHYTLYLLYTCIQFWHTWDTYGRIIITHVYNIIMMMIIELVRPQAWPITQLSLYCTEYFDIIQVDKAGRTHVTHGYYKRYYYLIQTHLSRSVTHVLQSLIVKYHR